MSPTRTRRTADETREAILRTAVAEFLRFGYDSATLESIADQLDITRPAVLYHFKSKELLFHAIVDPAFTAIEEVAKTLPVAEVLTVEQQTVAVRAMLDVLIANRCAAAVITRTPNEASVNGNGERVCLLNRTVASAIAGTAYADDPAVLVRTVACLAAISGLMAARMPVDLHTESQRETLTTGLVALLRG